MTSEGNDDDDEVGSLETDPGDPSFFDVDDGSSRGQRERKKKKNKKKKANDSKMRRWRRRLYRYLCAAEGEDDEGNLLTGHDDSNDEGEEDENGGEDDDYGDDDGTVAGATVGTPMERALGISLSPSQLLETYCLAAWGFIYSQAQALELVREMFTLEDEVAFRSEQDAVVAEMDAACELPALLLDVVAERVPKVLENIKRKHVVAKCTKEMNEFFKSLHGRGLVERFEVKSVIEDSRITLERLRRSEFRLRKPLTVGPRGSRLAENPNFYPFVASRWSSAHDEVLARHRRLAVGFRPVLGGIREEVGVPREEEEEE